MNNQFDILFEETFTSQSLMIDHQKNIWSAEYTQKDLKEIEEIWLNRLVSAQTDGRTLYNSDLFRLHSFCGDNQKLSIRVGDTRIRPY